MRIMVSVHVNKITAMHYATEQEFEMLLPGGIKKIRKL